MRQVSVVYNFSCQLDNVFQKIGSDAVQPLHKEEFQQYFEKTPAGPHFQKFEEKCVKLCWLMVCQDPPVALECSKNNMDLYRAYTKSGNTIDYIVWPSLLLHDDGPLLYKGVAQLKFKSPNTEEVPSNDEKDDNHGTSEKSSNESPSKTTTSEEKNEKSINTGPSDIGKVPNLENEHNDTRGNSDDTVMNLSKV